MIIPMTDTQKTEVAFYILAKAFIIQNPILQPWEVIDWINHRMGIGTRLSDKQVAILEKAWDHIKRDNCWKHLMTEHEIAKSIV